MESAPGGIFISLDNNDRIHLRNLSKSHTVASQLSGLASNLENTETGMFGEFAVHKWLTSNNLKVSMRSLDSPFEMKTDLVIESDSYEPIHLEIKSSSKNLPPIIPYTQSTRIQENSDYVIFCTKPHQSMLVELKYFMKTSDISKLKEKRIRSDEGFLIHALEVEPYLLIPMSDFLTTIKFWRLTQVK